MTTAFDSFPASALGAFVQSPLDARGSALGEATPCDLFAVDGVPDGLGNYALQFRQQASGLLAAVPSYTTFVPDAGGLYFASSDQPHPSGVMSQAFVAGVEATICDGSSTVPLTEGGEVIVTRSGLSMPVPDVRYTERELSAAFEIYQMETCSGTGGTGRWMQTNACGSVIDESSRWTALTRSGGNLAQRNFLGAGAAQAIGRAAIWGVVPVLPITGGANGVIFRQVAGTQSAIFVILWHLVPGAFAGSANGKDWYYHASHPGHVVFSWPLSTTGFATEIWLSDDGVGSGVDLFGLPNTQSGVLYRIFEL